MQVAPFERAAKKEAATRREKYRSRKWQRQAEARRYYGTTRWLGPSGTAMLLSRPGRTASIDNCKDASVLSAAGSRAVEAV